MDFQTLLVEGAALGRRDDAVVEALVGTWPEPDSGRILHVGIRNDEGQIYRAIHFRTMHDLMTFFERVIESGFVTEVSKLGATTAGFNMILQARPDGVQCGPSGPA